MDNNHFAKASLASSFYGVSVSTLRRWARDGDIQYIHTNGGHYRYLINNRSNPSATGKHIIYARVSSAKQSDDLERQISFLRDRYPNHTLVSDIGSGINFKRKGFQAILEQLFQRDIREVVVAYPDRFCRFGFDLFQWIFEKFDAKLTFVDIHSATPESEMLSDIMEILTVFTARYHGKRKYENKKDKVLPN